MQNKTPFCLNLCHFGREYLDNLRTATADTITEIAEKHRVFCEHNCPYEMDRDWKNPDGIEWWKLDNLSHHAYGKPLQLIGDIMTIERYKNYVEGGTFIPYDGHGYYCTESAITDEKSDFAIKAIDKKIAQGYKYVIWYNK